MAHILIMPRQGNTVESCIITNWKVKEGDTVTPETTVCEVETDKAAFEIPAGAAGTVLKLLFNSGDDVPVLRPIAVIGAAGEDWQAVIPEEASHGGTEARREAASRQEASNLRFATPKSETQEVLSVPPSETNSGISPRARNLAKKEALPLEMVPGTGPGGRIIERDIAAALQTRPLLTAAARAEARAAGAVPQAGSGLGGRITLEDLTSPTHIPQPTLPTEGGFTETPIKGIRKIIADRMHKSLAETAQLTLNASTPAAKLQEIRARFKTQKGAEAKITLNDLVLFAVARTLLRFPFMNAHKSGDTIKTFERVHLGVAVDTPRGLMVPVIRNADLLSLAQISSDAKRLAEDCQNGTVNPDDLSGSSFTVTNLGGLGITSFTPILNVPEVAILGVCGIEMKPIALPPEEANESNCGVRFEPHIGFSLTINHEAVDGAPAAKFLKALGEAVAQIDLLLADN